MAVKKMGSPDPESLDWVNLRGKTLGALVRDAMRASFIRHEGNRRAMMRELGISRSTLERKLDEFDLRLEEPYPEPCPTTSVAASP